MLCARSIVTFSVRGWGVIVFMVLVELRKQADYDSKQAVEFGVILSPIRIGKVIHHGRTEEDDHKSY
jgi:hypothetical protein